MGNLGSSFIVLAIAIILLWLAVTNQLGKVLDAGQVISGKAKAVPVGNASNTVASSINGTPTGLASNSFGGTGGGQLMSLPSLPSLGTLQA